MNKFRIKHVAAALLWLAGGALALPAAAQAPLGSASVSQLTWQLIDLNPSDGIAPEISFHDSYYRTEVWYMAQGDVYERRTIEAAGTDAVNAGQASISATSLFNVAQASAGLTSLGQNGWAEARGVYSTRFRLTPYTGVLFSVRAEVDAATALPDGYSEGSVTFNGSIGNYQSSIANSAFQDDVRTQDDALSLLLRGYVHSEAGDAEGRLSLDAFARANTSAPTSPVPEPATSAMLLAGLAIVGAGAARRRRAA